MNRPRLARCRTLRRGAAGAGVFALALAFAYRGRTQPGGSDSAPLKGEEEKVLDGSDGALPDASDRRSEDQLEDPPAPQGPPLFTVSGEDTDNPPRPDRLETPRMVCSTDRPVCVHGAAALAGESLAAPLASLERAFDRLVRVLGLPSPLADGPRGGGPQFDLYIAPSVRARVDTASPGHPGSAAPPRARPNARVLVGRDPLLPLPLDRASAFGLLPRLPPPGCELDHEVATALAAAIELGIDAGEQPAIRGAIAEHLADIVAPCEERRLAELDAAQRAPERALTSPLGAQSSDVPPPLAAGPPLFFEYLDAAWNAAAPGALPIALAALSSQKSPPDAIRFHNEPDLWDALRANLAARVPPLSVGDFLLDFAIARAFMGSRNDGEHLLGDGWSGSFGRVRFEWAISFQSLPRRLAPRAPIDPTGSSYVWIDLRGAPPGARLALRAEWEPPTAFRWAVVRVGADGREASRVLVTPEQRASSAERNVDGLDGLSGLIVVGVNVGDLGLMHPFDPDETRYEPHGYVLTLAAE